MTTGHKHRGESRTVQVVTSCFSHIYVACIEFSWSPAIVVVVLVVVVLILVVIVVVVVLPSIKNSHSIIFCLTA